MTEKEAIMRLEVHRKWGVREGADSALDIAISRPRTGLPGVL